MIALNKDFLYKIILSVCIAIGITSCIHRVNLEDTEVKEAIKLQESVINDPLFFKILKELDDNGSIKWQTDSDKFIPDLYGTEASKIDWFINKFENEGGFSQDSVYLWRKWNPWSSTTAVTNYGENQTKLNIWNIDRDKYSILNTLIHERVHTFSFIHPKSQNRADNYEDLAYIAGDLAEILALHNDGVKERNMNKPISHGLKQIVGKYRILKIK